MPQPGRADPSENGTDFQHLSAVEASRNILAAMLNSPEAAVVASSSLDQSDFVHLSQRRIFAAVKAILARGEVPDIVTVGKILADSSPDPSGDRSEFIEITGYTGIKQSLPGHMRVLREYGTRRRMVRFSDDMREAAGNPAETMSESLAHLGVRFEELKREDVDGCGRRFTSSSVSATELASSDIPEPASLLGNRVLTAGGFSILYGKPGVGKTWLALSQCLALARGVPWMGLATPSGGTRVGLLELELGAYSLQQRLRALGFGEHERDSNLRIICRPNLRGAVDLVRSDERESLRNWIATEHLELVVIDALSRAHTASEKDEQEIGVLLAGLDALRHETGCAIQPVHHERKGLSNGHDDDDDLDALRGHSRLQSDPTLLMRVKSLRDGKLFILRFAKVSEAATPDPIYFRNSPTGVELCESPEKVADGNRTKVLKALPYPPASVSNTDIQTATGLKRTTVLKHLQSLIAGLEVMEIGSGKRLTYCRSVTGVTPDTVTQDNRYESKDLLEEHGF